MAYVQFRIHPSVGLARYGNSQELYYVANDFPQFVQEAFPKTRTKPRSRSHPETLAAGSWGAQNIKTGDLNTYSIFDASKGADEKFKDNNKKIKPQAARFRVFAYVYENDKRSHPRKVFEVDADMADITWSVTLANLKAKVSGTDTEFSITQTLEAKQAQAATLQAKRFKEANSLNLGYAMLERKSGDKTKLNGRLHIIGNEGACEPAVGKSADLVSSQDNSVLWHNDWRDSGADGPVSAVVKIKDLAAFKTATERTSGEALKYLDSDSVAPVDAAANTEVNCVPAWCVVGPPDYCPDMGHFVSVWDLALDAAMESVNNGHVIEQPKLHRLIRKASQVSRYVKMDYRVHIHPQLCLFADVNKISSVSNGTPPANSSAATRPGHNIDKKVTNTTIKRGLSINPRDPVQFTEYYDESGQKAAPARPINERRKPAIFTRLRNPKTLYQYFDASKRHFVQDTGGGGTRVKGTFPRPLGRRVGYSGVGTSNTFYRFPSYDSSVKHLRHAHSSDNAAIKAGFKKLAGNGCGKLGSQAQFTARGIPADIGSSNGGGNHDTMVVDDLYWPATPADMPLLLELAYTWLQHKQFEVWKDPGGYHSIPINTVFDAIFPRGVTRNDPTALRTIMLSGSDDPDTKYEEMATKAPLYAPALIDMAYMGSMLGGSFLPGIEVGREAGRALNWVLMEGASDDFPDVRFKPASKTDAHMAGTLTKDLAMPWQVDFIACDEAFWPTARPGYVDEKNSANTVVHNQAWPITRRDWESAINSKPTDLDKDLYYYNNYWTHLGFVRRQPQAIEVNNPEFINEEVERAAP